jgi:hypothetical protein
VVPKKNWSKPPHHRPNHTHAYRVQRFFRVVVEAGGEFRPRGTFPQRGDFAHQLASFVFSCSPGDRPHRWEGWRSLQSKQRIKKSVSSDHTRPCIGTSQKQIQRRAQGNLHSDPSLSFQWSVLEVAPRVVAPTGIIHVRTSRSRSRRACACW